MDICVEPDGNILYSLGGKNMADNFTPQVQVDPVYNYSINIDTTPGATATWSPLCAGIESFAEALNEQVQQFFFMCAKGFANNYVTGMAPVMTITGRRVKGDAVQEFIFANKYKLMQSRETQMQIVQTDAANENTNTITCNVTIQNVVEINGNATDPSQISFDLALNGEPVLTTTPVAAAASVQNTETSEG